MWKHSILELVLAVLIHISYAEDHVDTRCSCKCPDAEEVLGVDIVDTSYPNRRIYINSSISALDCNCPKVVVPVLHLDKEQEDKFCPRCYCQHETRSVMTIKVVVGLIIFLLMLLFSYMIYLIFVDPMFRPRLQRSNINYQEHQNENDNYENLNDENVVRGNVTQMSSIRPRNMVSKVKSDQQKWKKQVEQQRNTVYDRHSMLNWTFSGTFHVISILSQVLLIQNFGKTL